MPHSPSHSHSPDHHQHDAAADAGLTELLDLDGQALHAYWNDVLEVVTEALAASGTSTPRILDLGAGSGTATLALARRFDDSDVVALDASPAMVEHIRAKAAAHGLDRVQVVQADLDEGWPDTGRLDLTWASMSMHHMGDPDRVLRDVFAATSPGGFVALAEFDEPLRFLPDDLGVGTAGLERRCLDALAEVHTHDVPELGSAWPPRITAAGFEVVRQTDFAIDLTAPLEPAARLYAVRWTERLTAGLEGRLDDGDLAALQELLGDGPLSIRHRDDLHIRGTRTLTLARRPA